MEEREAPAFDEEATRRHVAATTRAERTTPPACPSMAFAAGNVTTSAPSETVATGPMLSNWPVQLGLVPPGAPFLQDADVVLAADCTAYAYGGFHNLLNGRPLIVACPKLDDIEAHLEKLTAILQQSSVRSLTVVRMEVPCCSGVVQVAMEAVRRSGREIPVEVVVIGIKGAVQAS